MKRTPRIPRKTTVTDKPKKQLEMISDAIRTSGDKMRNLREKYHAAIQEQEKKIILSKESLEVIDMVNRIQKLYRYQPREEKNIQFAVSELKDLIQKVNKIVKG